MKLSAILSSARPSPSNITIEEKVIKSLNKEQNITMPPAKKGMLTVVLNSSCVR